MKPPNPNIPPHRLPEECIVDGKTIILTKLPRQSSKSDVANFVAEDFNDFNVY
jgi:hypothetical protein